MPFSFNPFYRVVESEQVIKMGNIVEEQSSSSRAYRRTLWEKIQDTFFVIAGNRANWVDEVSDNDKGNIARPGVLDYLTFQVTRMINAVTSWSWNNKFKDPIALMLIIPASVIFAVANTAHYALAGALTLIASPIVTVVHIFSQVFGGYALKKEAGKLHGVVRKEYATDKVTENTLNSFLNGTGHSYSDIIMDMKKGKGENQYLPTIVVMENHHKYECCINGDCEHQKGHIQFEVDLSNLTAKDKVAIKALIKLNAGSLRDNLRTHQHLQAIENLVEPQLFNYS
jgi:hypothetical protein